MAICKHALLSELLVARTSPDPHCNAMQRGRFKSGQMQREFEDAAFALNVGEISGIVSTPSGLHLIMRTPLEPLSE